MPPEPRLQECLAHLSDPQKDWREKVKANRATPASLDRQEQRHRQIPVSEAMKPHLRKRFAAVSVAPAEKKK